MTVLALTIHIHILEKQKWIQYSTGAYRIHNICVRRFDIIFAGLSCWISIQTYWNINNYSYSYFYQKKVINQGFCNKKNATRHTTYLLSPPQKKSSPSFTSIFQPKKTTFPTFIRWAPRANVAPEPTCPKWRWKPQGLRNESGNHHLKIWLIQKNWREDVSCLFFHPSVCDVSRLFGKKKRQFKPWMRLDTPSLFWNVY